MNERKRKGEGKSVAHPGAMLKALRAERRWTLAQVSSKTGLPIATLSKIENDKLSLSYDKLVRISEGLDIDISRLFDSSSTSLETTTEAAPTGRRSITRSGEGSAIETQAYSHLYPAADLLNKKIVPIIAELKARSREEFGNLIRHSGEEYAVVLEGAVELHTDLYAPLLLEKGDSIYFDSSMAHGYIAAAEGVCRVLSVCSAAGTKEIVRAGDSNPSEPTSPVLIRSA